jgi:hypothetical protein
MPTFKWPTGCRSHPWWCNKTGAATAQTLNWTSTVKTLCRLYSSRTAGLTPTVTDNKARKCDVSDPSYTLRTAAKSFGVSAYQGGSQHCKNTIYLGKKQSEHRQIIRTWRFHVVALLAWRPEPPSFGMNWRCVIKHRPVSTVSPETNTRISVQRQWPLISCNTFTQQQAAIRLHTAWRAFIWKIVHNVINIKSGALFRRGSDFNTDLHSLKPVKHKSRICVCINQELYVKT